MSDSNAFAFGKFIPGFDFLQHLASQGAASGQAGWVAPTVNAEELDRRIQELKAVLFWLEQNSATVKATIQALEVQKMTLAALANMNFSMAEVAKAFAVPASSAAACASPAASDAAESSAPQWPFGMPPAADPAGASAKAPPAAAPGMADPLQWWGALTQQFQQIAASTLHEAARAQAAADAGDPHRAKAAKAEQPAKPEVPIAAASVVGKKPAAARPARKVSERSKARASSKVGTQKVTASAPPRQRASTQTGAAQTPAADWPLPPPFKPG